MSICGAASADGSKLCVLGDGHDGRHGWDEEPKMAYRDYLIQVAASAASNLSNAIDVALAMDHEELAVRHLEARLATTKLLVELRPNPERVEARPPAD